MMVTKKLIKLTLMVLLGISIAILFILLLVPDSPINRLMLNFMEWIKNIPKFWGSILLTLIYAVSLVFCFPGTPINFAAGYIFGPWVGSVATVVGCDLGAVLAFFIGRNLTKEWTESKMQANPKYGLISSAVSKNGLLIIFLLRLSPIIPFGMCNYLFSATDIPFYKYWISTTLGLLPFTILYTYFGSLMKELTDIFADASVDATNAKNSSSQVAYVTFSVILSILIFVAVTIITKRTLNKAIEEQMKSEKLEKGLGLPLINGSNDDIEMNDIISMKNNNNNSNNNDKDSEITMFKRSPTDSDLSIDVEDNSSNNNNSNNNNNNINKNNSNKSNNGGSKDIILTINNDVQFQQDYENDDDYLNSNDKTFLIKSNTYNSSNSNSNTTKNIII